MEKISVLKILWVKLKMGGTVPLISEQPKDEKGYLEPSYRVPKGYIWTPQTGTVTDEEFEQWKNSKNCKQQN